MKFCNYLIQRNNSIKVDETASSRNGLMRKNMTKVDKVLNPIPKINDLV
jgi:hypothetical protein